MDRPAERALRRAGRRLRRALIFARHVRPSQRFVRLRLAVKRRLLVAIGGYTQRPPRTDLAVQPEPPAPIFPARGGSKRDGDGAYIFEFQGEPRRLASPFDWRQAELGADKLLWLMKLHEMAYLEALDDRDFMAVIDDWIAANPPYQPGYWRHNWSSYALSIRCVVWMQQSAVRRLPAEFRDRLAASLTQQIRFLARNLETDIVGNHLIKNVKALLWAGRFFASPRAAGWHRLGLGLLRRELGEQILADGMHYERSVSYHCQVFADLLECLSVIDDGPARHDLLAALAKMAQVIADLCHPDGQVCQFNDSGLNMAYAPALCLDAYRRLTGQSVAPRAEIALPAAGYWGVRRDDSLLVVDCGDIAPDFLPAHGHGDILSFEWSVGGLRLIVDAGVFEYAAGANRAYARSTAAHNTVTLDDADQCEFFASFRVGRRAHAKCLAYQATVDGFVLDGSHDGFDHLAGRPRHYRRFAARAGRLTIEDRIEGGAGQRARARFMVHPDCTVALAPKCAEIRRADVVVRLTTNSELRIEPGWHSPDLGERLATQVIVVEFGPAPSAGTVQLEHLLP